MKRLIFVFCALAVVASAAFADVPDPSRCVTTLDANQRLLMVPNTPTPSVFASFTVTIKNAAGNPINNAVVEILVGGIADNKTHLCTTTVTTVNTNATGVASFNIGGGGCYKGTNAAVIRANGVEVRNFSAVMSPDYAGSDNVGVAARWNMQVGLADFTSMAAAYGAGVASCHDYDNGGTTGLTDFTVFAQSYGKVCTQ